MKPILVLGMHRSGTSATTRALNLLGASLGRDASIGKFWENEPLRLVNEQLLEALGGGWECPPEMPAGWERGPAAEAVPPARARAALLDEFSGAEVGVWKDPRTCLTLPYWLPVFDESPVVVLIHRHPGEVADSLATYNGLGRAHALAVWERFNHDALANAVGLPTFAVAYEPLVEDPVGVTRRLVAALTAWGVDLPNDPATTDMELTPGRRHHRVDEPDRFADPVATESQRELFRILSGVDGVSDAFTLPGPLPSPAAVSVELLALAAQARLARRDAVAARMQLEHSTGSRRRIVRTLAERTVPERFLTRRPPPTPRPAPNRPPAPPKQP